MKSTTRGLLIVVGCIVLMLAGMKLVPMKTPTNAGSYTTRSTGINKSGAMQAQRYELMQELIAKDIFEKIEKPGSVPRVWVRPSFYLLDFRTKQAFVGVVYAYYFDGSNDTDIVRVIDSYSGKEVGVYSIVYGGLKMK